jgi:hypothetical protein
MKVNVTFDKIKAKNTTTSKQRKTNNNKKFCGLWTLYVSYKEYLL